VKIDEISSTEKLLEQIRGNRPSSSSPAPVADRADSLSKKRGRFLSILNLKKSIHVGVDIGYSDVRLIKTIPSAPHGHQIAAYRRVPFDSGLDAQNILFPQFLRNTLNSFIGPTDTVKIWTTISSARLDTRLLRIPKVGRRQIANAVIWAYKKKSPFNDDEKRFDFDILGETADTDHPQIEVLAYTIPRSEIDSIKASFTRAGFNLDGVSTYPFLLQNLLRTRWKILGQGILCALYIGRNWSRIDLFDNGNLMLSRGIRAGLNSMLEAIKSDPRIAPGNADQPALEMDFGPTPPPTGIPPETPRDLPMAVLAQLAPGLGPAGDQPPSDHLPGAIAPQDVFDMIRPALDRLVRQVERTIGHYAINFEERPIDHLCLSGMICESEQVRSYIAEQLGIPLIALNPFENENLPDLPDTQREQLAYIPAVGLASVDEDRTPNFLQTYHERSRREKRQVFNAIIFGIFLALMLGFLGYHGWQKTSLMTRHQRLTELEKELTAFVPLLKPETVLILAAKAKEATGRMAQFSDKYRGMALVAELSRLTPAEIRMTQVAIRLPRDASTEEEKPRRMLAIDGIIQGARLDLEPALATYLVQMKASPLLGAPRIIDKSFEMLDGREVLRFAAELEII
jgi:type IV pilus assembly protein PilM